MKKLFFTQLLFCLFLISANAAAQLQYKWITGGGSSTGTTPIYNDLEKVAYMCTDDDRNVYVISVVASDDIRTDTFLLAEAYNYGGDDADNVFITSYDCNGRLRWAKVIDAETGASSTGLAYSNGSVYLAGCMYYENKHIGNDTVINNNNLTDYVIKIDTSGQFKWVRFVGKDTTGNDLKTGQYGNSYFYNNVAVDGHGYIHYCDYLRTGVQVMPSVVSTIGTYDLVYDPSGNMLSATRLDLDSTELVVKVIVNKSNNNLYIEQYHTTDSVYFDGSWLIGVSSNWVESFSPDGTVLWVDTVNWPIGISDIACGGAGELYATAEGCCGVSFSIGGDSLFEATMYGYSGSIMRMDTTGHIVKHIDVDFGTNGSFTGICILPAGKLAVTGDFIYSFGYMGDTMTNTTGAQQPMIAIFDTSGTLDYYDHYRGDGFYNWGCAIASNKMGDIFLGGMVSDSMHINDSLYFISTGGNTDFFVTKYGYNCDCTPDSIPSPHFTATGSITMSFNYDGTGSADSVVWNFGDSTAGVTSFSPTHTYTTVGTYDVCATAYSGCGTGKWCMDVSIITTGVSNTANENQLTIFPDPASSKITVSGMHNATQIQVFNTVGVCVKKQAVNNVSVTLDISSFAPGTWLIMIRNADGSYVTRPFTKY